MKNGKSQISDCEILLFKGKTLRLLKEYNLYEPFIQYCKQSKASLDDVIYGQWFYFKDNSVNGATMFNRIYSFIDWTERNHERIFIKQLISDYEYDSFIYHLHWTYYNNVSALLFLGLIETEILRPLGVKTHGFNKIIFNYFDMVMEDCNINLYTMGKINNDILSKLEPITHNA